MVEKVCLCPVIGDTWGDRTGQSDWLFRITAVDASRRHVMTAVVDENGDELEDPVAFTFDDLVKSYAPAGKHIWERADG